MHLGEPTIAALERAVRDGLPTTVAELGRLVRIPSVSWPAFDPRHVDESAQAVAALLESIGIFDTVGIETAVTPEGEPGRPAVLARRAAGEGRPTVLLYAHHDVQPPGEDEAWETPPFEPTARGERLFGRGAADDKAGIMAHVAALRAVTEVVRQNELGLAVFVEGEEEFGSPSFSRFLKEHEEALRADAIIVADSTNWDVDTPALTVSLRGNVTFRLTVSTLDHPLHSGIFGGAVPDATLAMIRLLASLHDERGDVAVAGLAAHEQEVPSYDEARLRAESGLLDGVSPIGSGEILSRIWFRPAITVTGLDAVRVEHASNTLAAALSARVSVRVAPGQSGRDAFAAVERHLREHIPFGARLELSEIETGDGFLVSDGGPAALMREAMERAWGVAPVDTGIGGSIPFVAELARTYPGASVLITGVEDPDSRAHSPNESLHLGAFRKAILTEAIFLAELAAASDYTGRHDRDDSD